MDTKVRYGEKQVLECYNGIIRTLRIILGLVWGGNQGGIRNHVIADPWTYPLAFPSTCYYVTAFPTGAISYIPTGLFPFGKTEETFYVKNASGTSPERMVLSFIAVGC